MAGFTMKRRDALLLTGATLLTAERVLAQSEWPRGQTIKLVVPFTPGSGTDVIARLLGEQLGPAVSASIIVDNRAGLVAPWGRRWWPRHHRTASRCSCTRRATL